MYTWLNACGFLAVWTLESCTLSRPMDTNRFCTYWLSRDVLHIVRTRLKRVERAESVPGLGEKLRLSREKARELGGERIYPGTASLMSTGGAEIETWDDELAWSPLAISSAIAQDSMESSRPHFQSFLIFHHRLLCHSQTSLRLPRDIPVSITFPFHQILTPSFASFASFASNDLLNFKEFFSFSGAKPTFFLPANDGRFKIVGDDFASAFALNSPLISFC